MPYQKNRLAEFQATIIDNPYIPHEPTEKQALFLMHPGLEGFYGGAAGGGKSDALLMAALQYVDAFDKCDYAALLLRRTYSDLSLPGALMDRAFTWLQETDAKWHEVTKTWKFPSGATLSFGYLQHERDKYRYQSDAFQFIAFDELTQFTETQYLYLFSRLRRLEGTDIPLRMRSASNPGDIGHDWVKRRFILPSKTELQKADRFFISARLNDNPYIDQTAYISALNRLDPVTREQLLAGNWDIVLTGNLFKREWFEILEVIPPPDANSLQVRFWDMAATEPSDSASSNPDWTVGCLLMQRKGIYYIKDIVRFQKTPADTEDIIKQTAQMDGIETRIYMEQEPGASGAIMIDHYAREVLQGYSFTGVRSTGSKVTRAQPVSAAAQNRLIKVLYAPWLQELFTELEAFPSVSIHDDIVDALSGAFNALNQLRNQIAKPTMPSFVDISPSRYSLRY